MKPSTFGNSAVVVGVVVLMAGSGNGIAADGDGFVDLFDGKTLDGWVVKGGEAKYHVEDGAIVGTTVLNTRNTFLCTKKAYGDFTLELEFKVSPTMNSGVQIRSHVYEKDEQVVINGKRKSKTAGTVYGYQVEIDPSARAWTGGIYDESRRGWLNNLKDNSKAQKAFKQNEWNAFRIVCQEDHIRTWLNGVPAADLKDSADASGLIGLQVHGIGNSQEKLGSQVRWRNIRIKTGG